MQVLKTSTNFRGLNIVKAEQGSSKNVKKILDNKEFQKYVKMMSDNNMDVNLRIYKSGKVKKQPNVYLSYTTQNPKFYGDFRVMSVRKLLSQSADKLYADIKPQLHPYALGEKTLKTENKNQNQNQLPYMSLNGGNWLCDVLD